MPSQPRIEVACIFTAGPGTGAQSINPYEDVGGSWTDLTPWTRRISIKRGRQRLLDRFEPGTATITLDNRDRRFDPAYTDANLILNGSFEDGVADPWTNAGVGSIFMDSPTAQAGAWSLKLQNSTPSAWCAPTQRIPVIPGSRISLRYYWKLQNVSQSHFKLNFYQSDGTEAVGSGSYISTLYVPGGTDSAALDWTLQDHPNLAVPSNAAWVDVQAMGGWGLDGVNPGLTWIDSVVVVQGSSIPSPSPYYPNLLPMRRVRVRAALNLLTKQQASFEDSAAPLGWNGFSCNLANTTAVSLDGSRAMSLTATVAGTIQAATDPFGGITVIPGERLRAVVAFRSAATSRSCRIIITWRDKNNADISTSTSTSVTSSTSAWTDASIDATVPPQAVKAHLTVEVLSAALSEVHYIDRVGLLIDGLATWYRGGWYELFHGYVESWPQTWPNYKDAITEISCADAFKIFNLTQLNYSFPAQKSGVRIKETLDQVGWPGSSLGTPAGYGADADDNNFRFIDQGQSNLSSDIADGVASLDYMQEVNESELGFFFVRADGKVAFYDRHRIIKAAVTSQFADTDLTYYLPYEDLDVTLTDEEIWNEVKVTPKGGVESTKSDASSIGTYMRRTLARTVMLSSTLELDDHMNYLLTRFASPLVLINSIKVTGHSDSRVWPAILQRELGDKVEVFRRADGHALSAICTIQGVEHDITPSEWRTTYALSQTDRYTTYWVLDDSKQSKLGKTTRLAY